MSGLLFVVTAPSGAGKTSLIDALMREDPGLKFSVSYTTRAPRPGEKDGVDYHFVDDATFLAMRGRGEFLESAEVHGYRYGTSKKLILDALARGRCASSIPTRSASSSCRLRSRSWSGACAPAGRMPRTSSSAACRTRARSCRTPASSNTL